MGRLAVQIESAGARGGMMAGRMNWDRVRTDTLSRSHGSEWVESSSQTSKSARQKKKKKKKKKTAISLAAVMPGCTCRKPIGFIGLHRAKCPLCRPKPLRTPLRIGPISTPRSAVTVPTPVRPPAMTLSQFAGAIKDARLGGVLKNYLLALLKMNASDKISTDQQKHIANVSITAMLTELNELPNLRITK